MITTVLILALAISAMAANTKQLHYTITDLSVLGISSASGINNLGQITGSDNNGHAFLYTPGKGIKDLGTLPGDTASSGAAINDLGQVTGTSWIPLGDYWNEAFHAFIYSERTGMYNIGVPLDCSYYDSVWTYSINIFGQVTGDCFLGFNPSDYRAFLYSPRTGMENPETLDYSDSWGYGINDFGQVTGCHFDVANNNNSPSGNYHAFIYGAKSGFKDLGTLGDPDLDMSWSEGYAINNLGEVTGHSTFATPSCSGDPCYYNHAFLYRPETGMKDLGALPGSNNSTGNSINDLGQVVGYSSYINGDDSPDSFHAFLYSSGKMTDLNTLIDPSLGWTLSYAYGINDFGQIIGSGVINGQTHAFLMTPVY